MATEDKDWSMCTVFELRDECAKRNLDTTGKKSDLISRLEGKADTTGEAMDTDSNVMKGDGDETENTSEKKEEPKMLLKGKFNFYYNINHALKMVIVNPFKEEFMKSTDVTKWCQQAKSFDIEKDSTGRCEAVFYFDTVDNGEACFLDLRCCLKNNNVKVIHPATSTKAETPNSISISAGQYWTRLHDYSRFAKMPCTQEESKSEEMLDRFVVLENVPESVTEEDLLKKFPGSISVIILPYSEACEGIKVVEFPADAKILKKFNKIRTIKMAGVDVQAEKYSTRVIRWEKEKPKGVSFGPCTFDDKKRIEVCKELKELEDSKHLIINQEEFFGLEKIEQYIKTHEKIKPLQDKLKMDTIRRKKENLKMPEPFELKNTYTRFAEAPNFQRKMGDRNEKVFGRGRGGDGFRKRQFCDRDDNSDFKRSNRGGFNSNRGGGGGGFGNNHGGGQSFGGNRGGGSGFGNNQGGGGFGNNQGGGGFGGNQGGGGFGNNQGGGGFGNNQGGGGFGGNQGGGFGGNRGGGFGGGSFGGGNQGNRGGGNSFGGNNNRGGGNFGNGRGGQNFGGGGFGRGNFGGRF